MGSHYDLGRLEALAVEIRLVKGPLRAWKHLPTESVERPLTEHQTSDVAESTMEVDESGSDGDSDEGSSDETADDNSNEYFERKDKVLLRILKDICSLVRTSQSCSDYDVLLPRAQALIDKAAVMYCGDAETALNKSFAHSSEFPQVDGGRFDKGFGNGMYTIGLMFQEFMNRPLDGPNGMERTPAWPDTFRPHPLTTRLSRFKDSVEVTPTPEEPVARAIYDARCEITDARINHHLYTKMSPNAEIVLRGFATGWKDRTSDLQYHLLNQPAPNANIFPPHRSVLNGDPGHADHIEGIGFDESRKLFFSAEWHRVKSFRWGPVGADAGASYNDALPVHTFESNTWNGPLATFSSGEGKLIRAGTGSAGVWNLDSAPTHGASGMDLIGEEFSIEGSWRDDPEDIERSAGSPADFTIRFEDPKFCPEIWHPHPSQTGVMLTGLGFESSKSFAFLGIDLEGGGKFTSRYLGHGGQVTQISTVEGQAQTFVTSCLDGLVRLWDTRMALPALTLQASDHEGCMAAVYANPDGIPTVFSGAGNEEHIRLWDIRARTPVYELSTGNNAVEALAWDHKRNHLWAATDAECKEHGYRRANVPPGQETPWDDQRTWPKRAYHWENYFGVMFNAGESRLYRFAFKEEPDTTILPAMGL